MGFFSKLFKGDEDPSAAQEPADDAPARKQGDAPSARPASRRDPAAAASSEQADEAKARGAEAARDPAREARVERTDHEPPAPQIRADSPRPSPPPYSPSKAKAVETKAAAAHGTAKAPAVVPPPLGANANRKPSSSALRAATPDPENAAAAAGAPRKSALATGETEAAPTRRKQTIREFPAVPARPQPSEAGSRRAKTWSSGPAVRIPQLTSAESERGAKPAPQTTADEPELGAPSTAQAAGVETSLELTPALEASAAAEHERAAQSAPEPSQKPSDEEAAAIDRLLRAPAAPRDAASIEAERAQDLRAAAETFEQLLTAGTAPLRDFMLQLSVGRTPPRWAAAAHAVVAPFLAGARQLELAALADALAGLHAALERAAAELTASISHESTSAIEQAYAELAVQLPNAFGAPNFGDGRRLLLLESLLLQVPAMNRRALDKLYAAGLGSLDRLCGAKPAEIAAVTGLELELAEAIAERVRRFERERSGLDPAELRSQVRERLRAAVTRLAELQDEFERAEADASPARKRVARRAREATSRELDLVLAEVGELSLIEELKRCAVRSKIQRVESYLEQAPASA